MQKDFEETIRKKIEEQIQPIKDKAMAVGFYTACQAIAEAMESVEKPEDKVKVAHDFIVNHLARLNIKA